MKIEYRVKENGKSCINLIKTTKGKTGDFNHNKQNLFLNEYKLNNNNSKERRFVVSIRLDGCGKNDGYYKMSQMNFNKEELEELRNQIDKILSFGL